MELAIVFIAAYLIGSIPFGLILTRAAGLGDIRQIGSGNIGATNVLRTGNKKLAALTLFLDGFKGFVAVSLVGTKLGGHILLMQSATMLCTGGPCYDQSSVFALATWCSLVALLGHMFPVWLKFKGGKGVATILGCWLALIPLLGGSAILVWLGAAFISRRSSVGALAAVTLPVAGLIFAQFNNCWPVPGEAPMCETPDYNLMITCSLMSLMVILRHHENIKRLLAGTEPKIGKKT